MAAAIHAVTTEREVMRDDKINDWPHSREACCRSHQYKLGAIKAGMSCSIIRISQRIRENFIATKYRIDSTVVEQIDEVIDRSQIR